MESSWHSRACRFLETKANNAFASWLTTDAGKAWKGRARPRSPYLCGFSLPDWHFEIIAAMNANDEREAKALILANL